jgi:aspartyl-tRNA(Asn)/glutamyl-tRNA(Gln) amidotransferase subunit A
MSAETAFLGIDDIGARYRDGSLTPLAVVEAALARIDRLGPALNAFADRMTETALADAARRTAELAAGADRGPLHGIPVAIKDIVDVAGVPTGCGTRAHPARLPVRDAELVARLRAAGAIIMGKTNLLEYAYGIAHPAIGQTNNPHDTRRTAGGSSGGSAAAVAAGIVPVAIGTDTGGSIRIPASYCGIVGLKPSFDLVPTGGVFPLAWTLDHAGPLARNVRDVATTLSVLAGRPMPLAEPALRGLRIGCVRRHVGSPEVTAGVRATLAAAFATLRAGGAVLGEVDIAHLDEVNHALIAIVHAEAATVHEALLAQNPEGYAPRTRAQLEAGLAWPVTGYVRALRLCAVARAAVEAAFGAFDVLVGPSVPFVAPASDPQLEDGDGELLSAGFANLTGHPALSLNAGMSEGLPVGLQLVGRLGRDAELLSIASAIERVLPRAPQPRDDTAA